jgi:hypothetical protein
MPVWLSRTLLIGLGAVFVLLPFHAFISTWGGTEVGPLWIWKSWKELLLSGLFAVVLVWLVTSPHRLRDLFSKPYVVLLALYVLLTLIMAGLFFKANGADATAAGLAMNLRYLLAAVLAYILFRYGNLGDRWLRRAGWFLIATGTFVAVLGILQALVLPSDFFVRFGYDKETTIAPYTLIDDNPDLLRAFATLRGPNDFGAFLILPIVLVIAYARRLPLWVSVPAMFFMSWALVLSSSRSAWLGALTAIAVYGGVYVVKRLPRSYLLGGFAALALAGVIGLYAAVNVPVLRMAVFHSSPGDPSLTEGSTDAHLAATLGGINRVAANPLGCGPGCAGPASYYGKQPKISESYFVQIAEEVGIIGFALFVAMLVLISRELLRLSSSQQLARVLLATLAGYVVIGLLLHVWADDPLSMTWWMLIAALLGYNSGKQWKKSKDSSRSRTLYSS